jgi:uncharacterized protein YndB with AHSA1/START domain
VEKKRPTKPRTKLTLVITRIFDAPRSLVFETWTKKEHLGHWSAPAGFTIPVSDADFRPGGAWRCCMRAPDGTKLWLSGVYREIVQDERLVFTHAWEEEGRRGHETLVTVQFADIGSKTKITFKQSVFESEASRDGHKGGWNECLDQLGELLVTLRPKRRAVRSTKAKPHVRAKI